MSHRQLKVGYYLLEWLNMYATAYYFNYLFFHLRLAFGFGNRENLFVAALNGFIYIFAAWCGGKFAQTRGYFFALRLGFTIMALALVAGSQVPHVAGQFAVMIVWTLGVCLTWPTLEALVSENETRADLPRRLGLYNIVWASSVALAYFTGGALLDRLGAASLFWLPVAVHAGQLVLCRWLENKARTLDAATANSPSRVSAEGEPHELPAEAKTFLRMAWLANPFAYVAMFTVIPLIPDLAARLGLSTMQAGFVASVWMFARLFAFVGLWYWPGWHYRFGWLAGAYAMMVLSFAALLLAANLALIVLAQLVFGLAVGLIYSSSLFYSMDVGETKGEHGGFHEALIGVGIFTGPAVGATTLHFLPHLPDAGIWAVSAALVVGLVALVVMRLKSNA